VMVAKMTESEEIAEMVQRLIGEYHALEPRETVGIPWSEAKIGEHIKLLKKCLVVPYKQRFLLREGVGTQQQSVSEVKEYWVVAYRPGFYLEWFDPSTGDFGLGEPAQGDQLAASIGVRGDLVGVFCAM
jgi:hypothetical protein